MSRAQKKGSFSLRVAYFENQLTNEPTKQTNNYKSTYSA